MHFFTVFIDRVYPSFLLFYRSANKNAMYEVSLYSMASLSIPRLAVIVSDRLMNSAFNWFTRQIRCEIRLCFVFPSVYLFVIYLVALSALRAYYSKNYKLIFAKFSEIWDQTLDKIFEVLRRLRIWTPKRENFIIFCRFSILVTETSYASCYNLTAYSILLMRLLQRNIINNECKLLYS